MTNLALLKLLKIKETLSPEEYEKFQNGTLKAPGKITAQSLKLENEALVDQLEKLSEK
jgi:hypothetical protein